MLKPSIFISYSHKDVTWKERFITQLAVLEKQSHIDLWDDSRIAAGSDWYDDIIKAMTRAKVAVLLVSANFLTSKFILSEEIPYLLGRRRKEGLEIFPIIITPCAWQTVDWLSRLQVRPRNGKPLFSYTGSKRAEVLAHIVTEIYERFDSGDALTTYRQPESPNVNRIDIKRLPTTGANLFGRERELQQLDEAWAGRSTHILSLVAWGGVGKSALVNSWLARMALDDYRGATRVYGWSFYSQGTTDHAVSAEQFIEAALTWFGDTQPNKGTPWERGERLANFVGAQRALLILDGLEPLQYPPGIDEGRLKDQSLQSLLRQLAAQNQGLCVITTRIVVTELSSFEGSTVTSIDLEHLSPAAGAQVLRAQRVQGSQAELELTSREFGGHSLALTLLGSYLRDVYSGDVSRRAEVRDLEGDVRYGGHAFKVMASYERWLGEGPQLSLLRILGLFNRPAGRDEINALRTTPAIPGLTDTLQGLSEVDWQRVLANLRRTQLLAERSHVHADALDTHPLVREHFGQQLSRSHPRAWREGNNRLYKYLKNATKEFPDTLEEMAGLYAAIAHGCAAGKHQEALDDLFRRRVRRGDERFSIGNLGAFGSDLAALSCFFYQPWEKPVSRLTRTGKSYLLYTAGFAIRALGRLRESTQPMRAGLESYASLRDWKNAAITASDLSQTYLLTGDLSQALAYARQSVEFADKSGDDSERMVNRTTLATTLHQAGRWEEAEAAFTEAEKIQKERQSEFPILYSLWGFRYCEFLLDQGKYQEVQARVRQTLEIVIRRGWLLAIALNFLSLGRSYLLQIQQDGTGSINEAADFLEKAIDGLHQARTIHYLPQGLLARAELLRIKGESDLSQADLDKVMEIAARGSMGLYQVDCHLEYARLYFKRGEQTKARQNLVKAKELIKQMGYHRRDKAIKDIE